MLPMMTLPVPLPTMPLLSMMPAGGAGQITESVIHAAHRLDQVAADPAAQADARRLSEVVIQMPDEGAPGLATTPPAPAVSRSDQTVIDGLNSFLAHGETHSLPRALRMPLQQLMQDAALHPGRTSDRFLGLLGLNKLAHAMDGSTAGRAALNVGHTSARSLLAVALPTVIKDIVGRVLDEALRRGASETARTALGAAFLGVPLVGQLAMGVADELRGTATHYSRVTRGMMAALTLGTGGAAVATGTLVNPGMRFAETILYPLMRDSIQALLPVRINPLVGPSRSSLAGTGVTYAADQFAVGRAYTYGPAPTVKDSQGGLAGFSAAGLATRGVANAAGEAFDLYSSCLFNHIARNGIKAEQPQMRMGVGDLRQAYQNQEFWDIASYRGLFVANFGQFFDTMLDSKAPLMQALTASMGEEAAASAGDWITEGAAALLTMATYPFWPDPLHARGVDLLQSSPSSAGPGHAASDMEAGLQPRSVQQHPEPALADGRDAALGVPQLQSFHIEKER